jgi:hypothetical protein
VAYTIRILYIHIMLYFSDIIMPLILSEYELTALVGLIAEGGAVGHILTTLYWAFTLQ